MAQQMTQTVGATPWLEVDIDGLRKTLTRKGKAFAIYELIQNAWDEDAEVTVTLTPPDKNGRSVLTCVDNAPGGYLDLSHAHTMFATSYKREDATKRGRFNVGEKLVLALCDEARITSTTGQIIFDKDRTRRATNKKTRVGTKFVGKLALTEDEYKQVCEQTQYILPSIKTTFNGVEIPTRKPIRRFAFTLPTEVADEVGITRLRQRDTEIRLYKVLAGEKAMIYEKGLPVVEIDTKWHVDVQQKIPLNIERDNITPSYEKTIYVAVLNEMHDYIERDEAAATWVRTAMGDERSAPEAVHRVMNERFGPDRVSYDPNDKGSNREAASKNFTVIPGGAMSKAEWESAKRANAITSAGKLFPTNEDAKMAKPADEKDITDDVTKFVRFIGALSPRVLPQHKVTVRVINDKDADHEGCTRWKKDSYIFEFNLAYHDCANWQENYHLFIHELAHHAVQSNDHLLHKFYETSIDIAAKLVTLALEEPELFKDAAVLPAMEDAA
jgi:hypothetical protein